MERRCSTAYWPLVGKRLHARTMPRVVRVTDVLVAGGSLSKVLRPAARGEAPARARTRQARQDISAWKGASACRPDAAWAEKPPYSASAASTAARHPVLESLLSQEHAPCQGVKPMQVTRTCPKILGRIRIQAGYVPGVAACTESQTQQPQIQPSVGHGCSCMAQECTPLNRLFGGSRIQDWLGRLGGLQAWALCGAAICAGLLGKGSCRLLHVLHAPKQAP